MKNLNGLLKTGLMIMASAIALASFCASSSFAFDDNLPTIDPSNVPDNVLITFDKANPADIVNTKMIIDAPDKTIMDFSSFNISQDYVVDVRLPTYDNGTLASFLARDLSGSASSINGILNCNGLFILTNTNGINVGSTGSINAASLILATRDITNSNFVSANYVFDRQLDQQTDRLLLNQGTITISEGGFGVLIAGAIKNEGIVVCPYGTIALAGGDHIRMDISNNKMISIAIDDADANDVYDYQGDKLSTRIHNTGTLDAEGGTIIIKSQDLPGLFAKAVNLEGHINADKVIVDSKGSVNLVTTADIEVRVDSPTATIVIDRLDQDITLSDSQKVDNLITIEGIGLKVTYMVTSDFTLKTEGTVDTTPGAILYGNNITLIARQFGNTVTPLTIDSPNIHIQRTVGDIDILESTGIGTSVLITGPPEGFGKIIYPKSSSLVLRATRTTVSTDANPLYLYGNITFYNFECTTPGKTIYFEPGKTYTIPETFKIQGSYGEHVRLLSSEEGKQYYIDPKGTIDISYAWVQDSYNLSPDKIMMTESTNRGNCFGWDPTGTWSGTTSNLWSVAGNWTGLGGATPGTGDDLVFPTGAINLVNTNDITAGTSFNSLTLTGSGYTISGNSITLGAGGLTDSSTSGTNSITLDIFLSGDRSVTVTNASETLILSGVISGAYSLEKAGAGALTLSGTNTFGGAGKNFTLTAGTFNINNASAIGDANNTFIINGGTIVNETDASLTINYAQTWGGSFTIATEPLKGWYAPLNFSAGAVTLTSDVTITTNTNTHLLVGGIISGNYNLTKAGWGYLTLSGANTFGGSGKSFTHNGGYLYLNNASSLGDASNTFVISASTTYIGNTSGAPVTLNNYAMTWSSQNIQFFGPYDLNLGAGAVTMTRDVTLSSYTPTLWGIPPETYAVFTTIPNLTIGGVISGAYNLVAGAYSTGAVTLSGANTFGGSGKSFTFGGGILNINNASALGNSSNTFIISSSYAQIIDNTSGGAITLNNYAQTWTSDFTFTGTNDLNLGAGAVSMSTSRTVTVNAGTLTVGGIISGSSKSLTKAGAGTLTLTGVSTFNGGVVVNGGTLLLDLSTNTTGVVAAANTLTLGGGTLEVKGKNTGTSSQTLGNVTINAGAGSIILNANSGTGTTLTLGNTWTRNAGGALYIDISASGTGTLTSSPTLTNSVLGYAVVKDATAAYGFATVTDGNIVCYGGASALASDSDSATTNFYTYGNLTMTTANHAVNSLYIAAVGIGTLDLGGASDVLSLTSGSILLTGEANYTIQTGQLGANASDLIIHHFGSGTLTIAATLGTGGASLTKAGTGTAILSSANTYTGVTAVGAGTLKAGAANVFGGASSTSALAINGGTLDMNGYSQAFGSLTGNGGTITSGAAGAVTLTIGNDNTSPAVYDGIIQNGSGTVSVTKLGSGALTLGGANTYSGDTTLNVGTLGVNYYTALGTGTFIINSGTTIKGVPYGTNLLNLILNDSQWNGSITAGSSLNFGGNVAMGSDVTLLGSTTFRVYGVISGPYNLTISGNYLRLFGANTFGGVGKIITTNNNSGIVAYNNSALGDTNNTLILNSGSTGNIVGNSGVLYTITLNQIQWNVSSFYTEGRYAIYNAPVILGTDVAMNHGYTSDGITFNGIISGPYSITLNAYTSYMTLNAANTFGGAGKSFTTAGTLNINNASALGDAANTLVISGGTINNTSGAAVTLANNYAQTWSGNFAFTGTNNLNLGTGAVTITGSRIITVNGGTLTVGGVISGSGANILNKQGNGALTLSGANTFGGSGGGIVLTAGTLNINNAAAVGNSLNLFRILGGTTLNNTSGSAITLSSAYSHQWNGDFTFTGTSDLNLGTGAVSLSATRQVTVNGGTLTVGGIISGAGFGLTKAGSGTLTLSGNNTYTGKTTISAGTLSISAETGLGANPEVFTADQLTLNGGILATGSSEFSIDDSNRGVTLGASGGTFSQALNRIFSIANVIAGSGTLTQAGPGVLSLNGVNTYIGKTTISGGDLIISAETGLGANPEVFTADQLYLNGGRLVLLGSISTDDSNRGITLGASGGGLYAWTGTSSTVANVIAGSGALTKTGAGTLTLSGNNTYTGLTTISVGTLKLGATGTAPNGPLGTVDAGTVVADGAALDLVVYTLATAEPLTLNGTGISGGGALCRSSTVTGNTTYSGLITLGSSSSIVANNMGGGLIISNVGTITGAGFGLTLGGTCVPGSSIASIIGTGAGTLTKADAGTWTLSGVNTYTGTTTISAGTLSIGAGSTTGSIAGTSIVNNSALIFNRSDDLIYFGVISGTGTVTKSGAGALTLSGNNTYTGLTTISAGTLKLGAAGTAPNGPLGTVDAATVVADGAALDLNGYTLATAEALTLNGTGISSGGALMNSGVAATYSGLVTLGSTGVSIVGGTDTIALSNAGTITGSGYNLTLGGAQGGSITSIIGTGAGTLTKADAGTWTLSGVNTYTGTTTISAGTFGSGINNSLASTTVTVSTGATLDLADYIFNTAITFDIYGTLKLSGGRAVSTPTLYSGSTVEYTGSTYLGANIFSSYHSLTLSGTGTFTSPSSLTINGDFAHTGGIFSHNNGTVTFAGTDQSISGDTTFNNLTCDTAGTTLTFQAGSTQTVAGIMTLKGSASSRLTLQSSSSPTMWNIYPASTVSVEYLNVRDSYNRGAAIYTPTSIVINSINWYGYARPIPPPTPTQNEVSHATYENNILILDSLLEAYSLDELSEPAMERARAMIASYIEAFQKAMNLSGSDPLRLVINGGRVYLVQK